MEVRATKAVARSIVALGVRIRSSTHPRRKEATLLVITGSWGRRVSRSKTSKLVYNKCKMCNHVCQTGQELSFHMMSVHPHPGTHVYYYNINEKLHNINNNGIIITY
jgi:hypothetical protein